MLLNTGFSADSKETPTLNAAATMAKLEFLGMNFTCILDSLQQYQLPSTQGCLVPLLSKIIGYTIVAGASIVKLPQV
jgi:hypothetical protein